MIKRLLLLLLLPALVLAETPSQVDFLVGGLTDSSGDPLAAGKVYTYECGTTTNKATWQDASKVTPHTNPIILDAEGKKLVFADGCYKFRIDNASDVTQYTLDNLRFSLYNGGATYIGSTTGSSNAYVATLSPALLALADGAEITFKANHTNTGAATLNVNSLGAVSLVNPEGSALIANDILSSGTYTAKYDSNTNSWVMLRTSSGYTSWTPTLTPQNGTASSQVNQCYYSQEAKKVWVQCLITWTQNTSSASYADVTLPVKPLVVNQILTAVTIKSGASASAYGTIVSIAGLGTLRLYTYDQTALATGSQQLHFSGVYLAE